MLAIALSFPVASGTLVVTTQTTSGVVICADKRVSHPGGQFADDQVKIIRLSSKAALTFSGLEAVGAHGELKFTETIKAYVVADPIDDNGAYWTKLSTAVEAAYARHLKSGGIVPLNPQRAPDGSIFEATVLFLSPPDKVTVISLNGFLEDLRALKISIEHPPMRRIQVQGSTEVGLELDRGNNPAFDDIRHNKLFIAVWKHPPGFPTTTQEEAIQFSKLLIQITNERHHMIKNERSTVSRNYDCAEIGRNGFLWLRQNAK